MVKEKKSKDQGGGKKPPVSPTDLEKTTIDIDPGKLEREGDETLIVRTARKKEEGAFRDLDEEATKIRTIIPGSPPPPRAPTVRPREEVRKEAKRPAPPKAPAPRPTPEILHGAQIHPKPPFSLKYFALSLVFFLSLGVAFLEILRQGGALRFPAILCMVVATLALLGSLLRRLEGRTGFLWLTVAWFGLISYTGFRYFTSDATYFLQIPLSTLLGPYLFLIGSIVGLVLLSEKEFPFLFKIPAFLGWLLLSVAFLLSLLSSLSLEDNLWGPAFLTSLPIYFRPVLLSLGAAFPLLGLSVVLDLLFVRGPKGTFRKALLPLLLLCVMGSFLGAKLLARQGVQVPLLSGVAGEEFFGSTLLDPIRSPVRLIVAKRAIGLGQDRLAHLEVAASLPTIKGKSQQSRLMIRNMEGHSFIASQLNPFLSLIRAEKKIKGAKAELDLTRTGLARDIALVIFLPSLLKTEVKNSVASAIHHLANNLGSTDRLHLISAAGNETLSGENRENWGKRIEKILIPDEGQPGELLSAAFKVVAQGAGIKQMIYLSDQNKFPPMEVRREWEDQVQKRDIPLSFLSLGESPTLEENIYYAPYPSSLGFALMAAASESLGDYFLTYPLMAALPRIRLARSPTGEVLIKEGKLGFEVLGGDSKVIQSLQFKVDNEKPLELEAGLTEHVVDLSRLKLKGGKHQFEIQLVTQSGDVVQESFETTYLTRQPLRFVKPLDKDSVTGVVNVLFSEAKSSGLRTGSIDLYADGEKIGSATTEPFLISWDTTLVSPGEHQIQAVQTFSDGTAENAQIQVQVNPGVSKIQIVRPSNGEYLPNLAEVQAEVGGGLLDQVQKVDFLLDGEWIGESLQAPFRFLWSNSNYPAGKYFIQARAQWSTQAMTTDAVQVQLAQAEMVVQADPALSPTGRLFPDNVEILIDASVSMNEPIGTAVKLDFAKQAYSELSVAVPSQVNLITRVFGGKSSSVRGNCLDSQRLKDPARELVSLYGKGTAPLAYALLQMGKDLKTAAGSRVGLLITDSWDQCGQDPIAVAQILAKSKEKLRLHIIYFGDGSPTTESLLKRLAEVTGGRVYKVSRLDQLAAAVRDAVQVNFSLLDYKNIPVVEQPLSNQPFFVRAGEYRLEVDTSPPIQKDAISLSTGERLSLSVIAKDGKLQFAEETVE